LKFTGATDRRESDKSDMKIRIFELGALGTNGYLVWDENSREAMMIDPSDFSSRVEKAISENGLTLKYITLTHGHFDHVGGVEEFKARHPDAIVAAGAGESELPGFPGMRAEFTTELLLTEGNELTLGALVFQVLETPGHTPGGLSFYIPEWDSGLSDKAYSGTVFSGDTLFHGSIGRTDLGGGDFEILNSSIMKKLYILPDDTIVLPGHMDATTIGYEKRYNPFVR